MSQVVLAVIGQIAAIAWAGVVLIVFIMYRKELRQLLSKFSGIELLGFKASFAAQEESLQKVTEKYQLSVSKEQRLQVLKRLQKAQALLKDVRLLWADDDPGSNIDERKLLRSFGAIVDLARSTDEGLRMAEEEYYDIIISDISRKVGEDGVMFLNKLRATGNRTPLVYYVRNLEQGRGTPSGAFGITNRPDELLHFVVDVLERKP